MSIAPLDIDMNQHEIKVKDLYLLVDRLEKIELINKNLCSRLNHLEESHMAKQTVSLLTLYLPRY